MRSFKYMRAISLANAIDAAAEPGTMPLAGGTELLNWMKEGIAEPRRLIDLNGVVGLDAIEAGDEGLRIGALARLADVAAHPEVCAGYPAIAEAVLKSASPQIRNMATTGGNLMQRTRCPYFRAEVDLPCNKRRPGSGCAALEGEDRFAAIFGWSERCVATHPSDLAVALAALDATVEVEGPGGIRRIPVGAFHRLPGDEPSRETDLAAGEVITGVAVPASAVARRSHYFKVRERASYEFALVSAAVGLNLDETTICAVRIALGGVASKPWRLEAAERALRGVSLENEAAVHRAVAEGFADARPRRNNGFKIELARRTVVRALMIAGGVA